MRENLLHASLLDSGCLINSLSSVCHSPCVFTSSLLCAFLFVYMYPFCKDMIMLDQGSPQWANFNLITSIWPLLLNNVTSKKGYINRHWELGLQHLFVWHNSNYNRWLKSKEEISKIHSVIIVFNIFWERSTDFMMFIEQYLGDLWVSHDWVLRNFARHLWKLTFDLKNKNHQICQKTQKIIKVIPHLLSEKY